MRDAAVGNPNALVRVGQSRNNLRLEGLPERLRAPMRIAGKLPFWFRQLDEKTISLDALGCNLLTVQLAMVRRTNWLRSSQSKNRPHALPITIPPQASGRP